MSAIDLHARPSADFESKVARALDLLRDAAERFPGRVVLANSLGAEDMVITDLIARHQLPIALGTLDTGVLHAETLAVLPRIREQYGIEVEVYRPVQEAVIEFVGRHGERAMYESVQLRKGCCGVRKLEPLSRMLAGRDAWVTGMRREQSDNRGGVPFEDQDDKGRVKFNPLADWTWGDVWHYIKLHEVPYNALHDQFFPSIGCAPCTRAVRVGEPERAGRWWWENDAKKECGLHLRPTPAAALVLQD